MVFFVKCKITGKSVLNAIWTGGGYHHDLMKKKTFCKHKVAGSIPDQTKSIFKFFSNLFYFFIMFILDRNT